MPIWRVSTVALLSLGALNGPAAAGARQQAEVFMSEDPGLAKIEAEWGFADAIVIGDTIYVSGVVAGIREGESDLKLGYERAFERIGATLKRAGASWDDVVDITSFHTDLTTQMPAIVAVKNRYVKPPFPAWTAIQVSRLIPNNGVTEIKVVAKIRTGNARADLGLPAPAASETDSGKAESEQSKAGGLRNAATGA